MFDPHNADCILKAAEHIRIDDEYKNRWNTSSKEGFTSGFQTRLRAVPVCGTCLCIYSVIHSVVTRIRIHRLDIWANREQQRQHERKNKSIKNKGCLTD